MPLRLREEEILHMNEDNASTGPVPDGSCIKAILKGQEVAIFNVGGELYATQATCTHRGGPLCEGSLVGDIVTCPWHGSQFNVRTGEVVHGPADEPLETFRVEVKDGKIFAG
jgi:nitrite reductase/ring-hydroxylating ferredoxin subunit